MNWLQGSQSSVFLCLPNKFSSVGHKSNLKMLFECMNPFSLLNPITNFFMSSLAHSVTPFMVSLPHSHGPCDLVNLNHWVFLKCSRTICLPAFAADVLPTLTPSCLPPLLLSQFWELESDLLYEIYSNSIVPFSSAQSQDLIQTGTAACTILIHHFFLCLSSIELGALPIRTATCPLFHHA